MKVKSVLVSQPVPAVVEKSPYYEIHTKHSVTVDYRPFIRVEGVSLKDYRSQRIEIPGHTAVVFTSRTTVDNFFRICEQARITVPETMKYLCSTEAIALYLQKYIVYRKRKIFFASGQFSDLMELILKHKNEKFLLVLSEPYNPELSDTMAQLKLDFDKIVLSRTVSADLEGVEIGKYDLLAFFSPAEITSLISQFGSEGLPMIATFGDGTTRAAIEAGITVNVMAPTPEAPSMAKAIGNFITKVNAGQSVEPVVLANPKQSDEFLKTRQSKPQKKARVRKPVAKPAAAAVAKPTTTALKSTDPKSETNTSASKATRVTAAKSAAATKPMVKPTEKPVSKHASKSAAKPADKSVVKSAVKPAAAE